MMAKIGWAAVCIWGVIAPVAEAQDIMMFEDFSNAPETRWVYVADGVMGGVSQGQAKLVETDKGPAMRLTGAVSTENNGGFIQMRQRFEGGWPTDTTGLAVTARGNGETYYVFLRTQGLARVWFSYRHAFVAEEDWTTTRMSFSDFYPSHQGMPDRFKPEQVIGIGIVAYGKDFAADVTVREVALIGPR